MTGSAKKPMQLELGLRSLKFGFESHEARAIRRTSSMTDARRGKPVRVDSGVKVFCQPSIAPDPREEPLDDPALRVNSKASLIDFIAQPAQTRQLLARSGSDAFRPQVRGTYSAEKKYRCLDIVTRDGSSFIARRDFPGACPGEGWQLLVGAASASGPQGPQGEKGKSVVGPPGKLQSSNRGARTVFYQGDVVAY